MALSFNLWSRTAASNATADPAVNWAEGQLPSTVNDSARAMMASAAAYRDDVAGAITTGGTATAFTVTSYQVFSSLAAMAGQMIAFVPHATNTNAVGVDCTLNVDGLGAKSIRMVPSVAIPNGTLILGTPYVVTYNNSDAVFYLRAMTNPYNIPLGAGMDFWGTTAPNTSFAFPIGQALSRTTYATLFSIFGTTFGVGDGSSTFNIPDKTGRVTAMKEASATRLTSGVSGVDGATLGATGAAQTTTIVLANLPPYTPAGTVGSIAVNSTVSNVLTGTVSTSTFNYSSGGGSILGAIAQSTLGGGTLSSTGTAPAFTGTAQGGSSAGLSVVQPTIVANYIIRVI